MTQHLPVLAAVALAVVATAATGAPTAAPRGFTVEDLVAMERVGAPAVSPDGARIVYTVRSTDLAKNKSHTDLYMVDLRTPGAAPQRLTADAASSTDPEWSAAGDAIYFLSSRSGSSQVWRVAATPGANGGTATKVTDLPLDVDAFRVSPSGDRLALSMAVFRNCADLACTAARMDAREKDKSTGKVYDRLFVRHWDTWADGRNAVLYSVPLDRSSKAGAAGTAVSLSGSLDGDVPSKPFGDREEFRFSPDGKNVVFSVRIAGKTEAWSTNFDLYTVPAAGGQAPRNLTADNPAWDTKGVFAPDGRTLAYLAMARPGFEADRYQIMLLDVASGKKRKLAADWDRSPGTLQWAQDGKSLVVDAEDIGQHRLFSIDAASGKVTPLTGQGSIGAFDLRGGTLAYTQANLSAGAQLFSMKLGAAAKPTQLTSLNTERLAGVRWGEAEQFSFTGANGDTVHGYVMKPWNYEAGKKYPVAFLVQGSFGNSWSYRWNPQTYAGAGYAAVFIDFHGSTGYGQKFTDAISGDWGGKPLEDLQKGLAAAVAKYPWLDRSRACALGASYGGYMMNWIEGNWSDGFKCIVNHDGVFDTRGMAYATEEQWFTDWENGGPYFSFPEKHERFNPVLHVNKWKTPMLVVQGDLDFRIPTAQGLSTFTALQRRGIDSKLLVFPDENHWVLKPANSVLWHHTVIDWLDQYLKQ
jgi:dipeptidyl aminopeptidase/acylaminoacyl peptidase